jgi:hypothetical protein
MLSAFLKTQKYMMYYHISPRLLPRILSNISFISHPTTDAA